MKYEHKEHLNAFLENCERELLNVERRRDVIYPETATKPWQSEIIKSANKELLANISGSANVYALFIADRQQEDFRLSYIGQSNSKGARTRLTNHLIKKHNKTGAKLQDVIDHVQANGRVQVAWISVDPMSLRHYVEEELIRKHKDHLTWNKRGKTEVSQ